MTRLLRGGVRLSDAEHFLLQASVERLDPEIRGVVVSQFKQYNLVQREVDGRALNFYKIKLGRRAPLEVSELLAMTAAEAPLIRISVVAPGEERPLHAVLTAVNGRASCLTFDRVPPSSPFGPGAEVIGSTQSWRSEVRAHTRVA
jgi:hypothetical protein